MHVCVCVCVRACVHACVCSSSSSSSTVYAYVCTMHMVQVHDYVTIQEAIERQLFCEMIIVLIHCIVQ